MLLQGTLGCVWWRVYAQDADYCKISQTDRVPEEAEQDDVQNIQELHIELWSKQYQ